VCESVYECGEDACVFECVCVCLCMCVTCVYVRIYMCVRERLCDMCIRAYIHVCERETERVCVCVWGGCMCMEVCMCANVCMSCIHTLARVSCLIIIISS